MTAREFLTNVTVILIVMAAGALLEAIVPFIADAPWKRDRRGANLAFTALSFTSNWVLASISAVAALSWRPAGLLTHLGIPAWLAITVGVVTLDFSVGYLSHRTMHAWPLMWRFHQVHHNDPFVDVTTTYRTHPVESVWRFLFGVVPIWILGIPAQAVMIQRLLQATNGVIEHANIRLWPRLDRVLSLAFVTPNVHKIHHSRQINETNSNYANLTTIYDRLLGTYTPAECATSVVYGLEGTDPGDIGSFPGLLALPFRSPRSRIVSDKKVRLEAAAGR